MKEEPVTVSKIVIEKTMNYMDTPVLHYKIEYPRLRSAREQTELEPINDWYRARARELQNNYETEQYQEAVKLFEYSMENQFPFHMFEAFSVYDIPYNRSNLLSLYYDHYIYSGGAHGNTVRKSDTWNIIDGNRIGLYAFTDNPVRFREEILENIKKQIAMKTENGENMYFEDYQKLAAEYFNPESFYLTPQGIVIYYQQYEIAPYASGIPEFTISA